MTAYADRVQEVTSTTGTGTLTLGGAVVGYRTFASVFTTGQVVYYCVTDGTNWEVGYGAFTAGSPNTLARSTVLSSSNSNALVNFITPPAAVFCTLPAAKVGLPTGGNSDSAFYEHDNTITTSYVITSGKNVVSAGPISINNNVTITIPNGSVWAIV
jgi:hypothetical protein